MKSVPNFTLHEIYQPKNRDHLLRFLNGEKMKIFNEVKPDWRILLQHNSNESVVIDKIYMNFQLPFLDIADQLRQIKGLNEHNFLYLGSQVRLSVEEYQDLYNQMINFIKNKVSH